MSMSRETNSAITTLRTIQNNALGNLAGIGTIGSTTTKLRKLVEGLAESRNSPNPLDTKERQAADYLTKYTRATKEAQRTIENEREILDFAEAKLWGEAKQAAKFDPPANQSEIRQALLSMSLKERNKALQQSAEAGNGAVLAAIADQPDWLWGGSTLPVNGLIDDLFESASPGYKAQVEQFNQARSSLDYANRTFTKAAEGLRDLSGEQAASDGQKRAAQADQLLNDAIA